MDLKQIKELMTAMEKAGLKKIRIKEEKGFELELEKYDLSVTVTHPLHRHETHPTFPSNAPTTVTISKHPSEEEKKHAEPQGKFINSPMVGTFYSSPSPDDPHFVKVGDRVEEDTIVCIIEAMKVMNEVKAGLKGVVAEILVENAHPVEFGSKMFRIV